MKKLYYGMLLLLKGFIAWLTDPDIERRIKKLVVLSVLLISMSGCNDERTNAKGGSNYQGDDCENTPGACVKTGK